MIIDLYSAIYTICLLCYIHLVFGSKVAKIHKSKDVMVNNGGRVYCIRANKAVVDGLFINTGAPTPNKYNPALPFMLG